MNNDKEIKLLGDRIRELEVYVMELYIEVGHWLRPPSFDSQKEEQHAKKSADNNYVTCSKCGESISKYICTYLSDEMSLNPNIHTILCPICKPSPSEKKSEEYSHEWSSYEIIKGEGLHCLKCGKSQKSVTSPISQAYDKCKPSPSSEPSVSKLTIVGNDKIKKIINNRTKELEDGSIIIDCDEIYSDLYTKEPLVDGKEDDEVEILQGIKNNLYNRSKRVDYFGCRIIPEENFESIAEAIHRFVSKRKPELVPLDEELKKSLQLKNHYFYPEIASFIMEDRKRICDSLVKLKSKYEPIQWLARLEDNYCGTDDLCKAIDETLKRAGLLNRKDG